MRASRVQTAKDGDPRDDTSAAKQGLGFRV